MKKKIRESLLSASSFKLDFFEFDKWIYLYMNLFPSVESLFADGGEGFKVKLKTMESRMLKRNTCAPGNCAEMASISYNVFKFQLWDHFIFPQKLFYELILLLIW